MATIEHVNIEDPFIHEPTGIATADANDTYLADGAGSGSWVPAELHGEVNGVNTRTGNYTLVLGDKGYLIEMNVASANTLTVPPNASVAFPVNTRIDVIQLGAGETTIVAGSGVTINSFNSSLTLLGQYAMGSLYKRATDEWVFVGQLL